MCSCGGIPEQKLALSKQGLQVHDLRHHQGKFPLCGCRNRMTGMHVHAHIRTLARARAAQNMQV